MAVITSPHRQRHPQEIDQRVDGTVGRLAESPHATLAWAPVLAVAIGKVILNLAVADRYGWHRDELYYRSAGQHLALGYVDFPPITPLLAHIAEAVFGPSLVGLRVFAIAAGVGVIFCTAALARELGGRRWAQVVAALAVTPLTLGSNAMFQTVSFDQLAWALVLLASVRVLRTGSTRSWLALGGAVGFAMLTKYTVAVLLVALLVGFVTTRPGRARLRSAGPALAAVIAFTMVLPNLWWQATHGWPSVDFFAGRNGPVRQEYPPAKYVAEFLLLAGLPAVGLWVGGIRSLLRDARYRAAGIAAVAVPPVFLLLGGKGYYAVPVVAVALAAGAAALEPRVSGRGRRALPAVLVAVPLLCAPFILPVLTESTMVSAGLADVRSDYAEEIGWPDLAGTIVRVWEGMTPAAQARTAILAGNYGEAGAIDLYGGPRGLPPVVSADLTWRYWAPSARNLAATDLIVVGYDRSWLAERCRSVSRVATVTNRAAVDNEEHGGPVFRCRLPDRLAELWPELVTSRR